MNEAIPAFGADALIIALLTILNIAKHAVTPVLQNEALPTRITNDLAAPLVALVAILHVVIAPLAVQTTRIQKALRKALPAPQVLVIATLRNNRHPLMTLPNLHFYAVLANYLRNIPAPVVLRVDLLGCSVLVALCQAWVGSFCGGGGHEF